MVVEPSGGYYYTANDPDVIAHSIWTSEFHFHNLPET